MIDVKATGGTERVVGTRPFRPSAESAILAPDMTDVVQKLWGFCHTLRHDGIDYGDYIE